VRTELCTFTNSETTVLHQRLDQATFYILIGDTRTVETSLTNEVLYSKNCEITALKGIY